MFNESNVYCRSKYRSKLAKENEKPTTAIYYVDPAISEWYKKHKNEKKKIFKKILKMFNLP